MTTAERSTEFISGDFFYHFPCLRKHGEKQEIIASGDCGDIIAEDNKWVSSLMRSFDTTETRSLHIHSERSSKLSRFVLFSFNYIIICSEIEN